MNYRVLKQTLSVLRYYPIHPQWFAYRRSETNCREIGQQSTGTVLDIGCMDQYMQTYLAPEQKYIGLDYYQTALNWYTTRPHVYGDAQALPIASACIDTVLLLDVLEHLPNPEACVGEIARVLKPGGRLILQVPFLYPLHDTPLDFQRWTKYGLSRLVEQHGFQIRELLSSGHPAETAGLLFNIALSKIVLNWLRHKNPALLLGVCILPLILLINGFCALLSLLGPSDEIMPHSYRMILEKTP